MVYFEFRVFIPESVASGHDGWDIPYHLFRQWKCRARFLQWFHFKRCSRLVWSQWAKFRLRMVQRSNTRYYVTDAKSSTEISLDVLGRNLPRHVVHTFPIVLPLILVLMNLTGMMSMDQVSIVNGTPNQIPILINVKSMESSSKLLGKQQLRRVVLVV